MQEVHFIEKADEASELLKPTRIEILSRLSKPRSCPELARELGMTTQKVNYHMNALKKAGLVSLVEERRKRGTIEGVYRAVAKSYWFSPRLVKYLGDTERSKDQASLTYLLQLAEDLQVDIGQMIDKDSARSMPSLGVKAQIQLRDGTDRDNFLAEIKDFFSHLAHKYGSDDDRDSPDGADGPENDGTYQLALACYPGSGQENNIYNQLEGNRNV